jgi:hypothetical protein
LANAYLKANLMDAGFSEAAGYLSPLGALEREGLESTLCLMFADALDLAEAKDVPPGAHCLEALAPMIRSQGANDVEFDFLSHSLGSRMLYDVLSPYDPATTRLRDKGAVRARRILVRRTKSFFMAANQLPLLAVGDLVVSPAQGQAAAAPRGLASVLSLRAENASAPDNEGQSHPVKSTPSLTVLAFQDPDDILGFKASDAAPSPDPDAPRILDIAHRNAPQWAYLFEWPTFAHDHELRQSQSLALILCGGHAGADGVLTPDRCPGR